MRIETHHNTTQKKSPFSMRVKLSNSNKIALLLVGGILTLRLSTQDLPSYIVKKGDTISKIAHEFNNSYLSLAFLNPEIIFNSFHIKPGQQVRVYTSDEDVGEQKINDHLYINMKTGVFIYYTKIGKMLTDFDFQLSPKTLYKCKKMQPQELERFLEKYARERIKKMKFA